MNKDRHCWRCEARCNHQCSRCRVAFYRSKECQKQDKWRHEPDCNDAMLTTECFSCGREQERMMKCTSCMKASYCNVECQRNHWQQHMPSCQETREKIVELANKIKTVELLRQRAGKSLVSATQYWGNVPAVDLINLSMNEGEEYSDPLALLLCGVGDPRNVLLTISSLPDAYQQQVTFVLNDVCPCTLARTVLLLYMLHKGKLI